MKRKRFDYRGARILVWGSFPRFQCSVWCPWAGWHGGSRYTAWGAAWAGKRIVDTEVAALEGTDP